MKIKQAVVLVITMVFLLSMNIITCASFTDISTNPHKEAIEEMTRLGILEGVGNNLFDPDTELNRATAAKVAAFLLGYTEEDEAAAIDWTPMFNDVHENMEQHKWALGWINLVANDEVIQGVPGGEYLPDKQLQMVEWVAILLRILGHEQENMIWPEDYNQMAENLGLTSNLEYMGSNIVNRAEMARMTTTAIFDAAKPDGKKIIDIVEFNKIDNTLPSYEDEGYEESEHQEEVMYENIRLSVTTSKKLLPAGGNKTIQITAYVTHGDNLPAEGVNVEFFVHQQMHDKERSSQLSVVEAVTDVNGIATSTYTTLAEDDNKLIHLKANARGVDEWIDKGTYIIASNEASLIEGYIINPFTGEPYPNVDIGFYDKHTNNFEMMEEASDESGYYSIAMHPGEYYISFDLDLGDKTYYSGSYDGSHHEFRADNTVVLKISDIQIGKNENYYFNTEMGIMKGNVTNLGSHNELYIYEVRTQKTVIATVNPDGSFMLPLPEGTYEINAYGGHILKTNVNVEKGKVTDLGSFSR